MCKKSINVQVQEMPLRKRVCVYLCVCMQKKVRHGRRGKPFCNVLQAVNALQRRRRRTAAQPLHALLRAMPFANNVLNLWP